MNNQILKLLNVSKVCRLTFISRHRPTIGSRLQHLGHDRQFEMGKLMRICNTFHILKSKNLSNRFQSTTERSNKEQTENILTIPNVLTVGRMVMCPFLGYLVINNDYSTAFSLFIVAGITDLVYRDMVFTSI